MTGEPGARPWMWLGIWLGVASLAAAGLAQDPPEPGPLYLEIAKRYAAGDRAAALTDLARISLPELEAEMDALRARVRAPAGRGGRAPEALPLRAMVLLHTDRDELDVWPSGLVGQGMASCGVHAQAELAQRAAALLEGDDSGRGFVRRWYLAMALRSLAWGCQNDAEGWARAGLKGSPRDAELLFATAVILEMTAVAATVPPPSGGSARAHRLFVQAGQARRRGFVEAKAAFEQVLAADPARDEAWLHLACIHLHLDRPEDARKVLEGILGRSPPPAVRYLAHLFLGRAHEAEGRPLLAEARFRSAFDLDPTQTAAVALSHLLQMKGETEEARLVLAAALREAPGRTAPDPFWVYSFGPRAIHSELFERLREEAGG